ncbi:MAG: DUF6149 family protein [Halobacteria archaeon]
MKIKQNIRHFAAKKALTTPVVGDVVEDKLVDLHTKVFLDRAPQERRDEREEHLDDFFEATIDCYVEALKEGYTEAEAREITHIQANFDFYNHGWTEMMEFPADEVEDHIDRYPTFFDRHGITVEDPLGNFAPPELSDAPETPEKLEDPEHPYADEGYEDDVYVDTGDEVKPGGTEEPGDVSVDKAPGVREEEKG